MLPAPKPIDNRRFGDVPVMETPQWTSVCSIGPAEALRRLVQFDRYAFEEYLLGSPRTDLLLTLFRFNVFRALVENSFSLGSNLEWLQCDAISSFCDQRQASPPEHARLPSHLRPTSLQHTIEHHPWIDLFPLPELRDNILRQGEDYDDTALCYDLVESQPSPGEWSGLIVWGDPWHSGSWEISEGFARKWPWVIQGCSKLFESTNYWRTKRGESKLFSGSFCVPRMSGERKCGG